DRCQMEAIKENDEYCEVDAAQCIGCALCVTTCPVEAISLVSKPEISPPPKNIIEMKIKISKERGIL
ncbi:MAG: 4Fe-4S binding protein, partial [Desulfobacula sp.]|uniref:4Fe-4S binding protein n=1 Tax=Desulfobacula sp. TaxID=2593537 RepID=UPI0025BB12F9